MADRIRMCSYKPKTLIDRTTPTVVVNQLYNIQGNGGRKLVRLENGWLISVVQNSIYLYIYKSMDDGLTWTQIRRIEYVTVYTWSITSKNNYLFVLSNNYNIVVAFYAINCISGNEIMYRGVDGNQTAIGNVSLAINPQGTELHACWSSKNSTYPNSFNIRYCKGIILSDGSVSWGSVERVSVANASGDNWLTPCIVLINNVPNILAISQSQSNGTHYRLYNIRKDLVNNKWVYHEIYHGGFYFQSSPSACVDKDGVIYVVWISQYDSGGGDLRYRMMFSKTLDGGIVWTTSKIINPNGNISSEPSIVINSKNKLFVRHWHSSIMLNSVSENGGDSWTYDTNITYLNQVSLLDDNTLDFEEPLGIYRAHPNRPTYPNAILFMGKWYE